MTNSNIVDLYDREVAPLGTSEELVNQSGVCKAVLIKSAFVLSTLSM
jgi:hypothetical protein